MSLELTLHLEKGKQPEATFVLNAEPKTVDQKFRKVHKLTLTKKHSNFLSTDSWWRTFRVQIDDTKYHLLLSFEMEGTENLKKMEEENNHYQTHKNLQGTYIPKFLAFYSGTTSTSGKKIRCMILEDVGVEPDVDGASNITAPVKISIMQLIEKLHQNKLPIPKAIDVANICWNKDKNTSRLVELVSIKFDMLHNCNFYGHLPKIGTGSPDAAALPCDPIRKCADCIVYWSYVEPGPEECKIQGKHVIDENLPDQETIDKALAAAGNPKLKIDAEIEWLKKVGESIRKGSTVEQAVKKHALPASK